MDIEEDSCTVVEEDTSTVIEKDSSTQVEEDSSAAVETVATPYVVAQPVTRGLNLRGAGIGLINPGRTTCYVNSALQVLLHTPPVLQTVLAHECELLSIASGQHRSCVPSGSRPDGLCFVCALKTTALKMYAEGASAFEPMEILNQMWRESRVVSCVTISAS